MDNVMTLKNGIGESKSIVFFGGAGVSTESGIKDFRSVDGLYNEQYDFPPEEIISRSFFLKNPEVFYRFCREKLYVSDAEPNITHRVLARLENEGKLSAVVTQNIDSLHQKAGSRNVFELHGTMARSYCDRCRKIYDGAAVEKTDGIPRCSCGGMIRPDIVLYEEGLDNTVLRGAIEAIREADMLIVGGTSLAVYPAAGLINYYKGDRLVLINKTPTPYDKAADLLITDTLGNVFSRI